MYGVWQATPAWTVKGRYSHGFKAPNLKQIVPGGRTEGPNVFLGNPALTPETSAIVMGTGAVTAILAASIALVQNDIKRVLAYSTVSQLGYMFMPAGAGAYWVAVILSSSW